MFFSLVLPQQGHQALRVHVSFVNIFEQKLKFLGWTDFCSFVKSNASIPDQWVWHMEGGGGDMLSTYGELQALLKTYGLPNNPVNIDEYSTYPEQVPSGSAWWIAQ